uniref:Putative ovule protein n=1 Tax=Solanum chacoense TaxID=4108 RepID=A0A0V0I5W3_SOLCH
MASLPHFLYQNLFLPLATVFAFVSLYLSPLFNSITTFVHRLRWRKAPLNKNSGFKDDYKRVYDFPETEQQLGYESDVFKDVSELPNSETKETEFNFTFKFPTYEEFCKSKEDKVEFVSSTFNIKSLTKAEVVETEDLKEVHSNIEAINEEDKKGDLSNLECEEHEINEEEKVDLCNLEYDKDETEKTEEMNSMKGESDTRKEQFLKELDFTDDSLFQSEKDSISTDSDTVSIGFDHICYLMNKLVDSYSDGFLTDEDFGGEFELDSVNDLEISEENQESDSDDSDRDIMEELRKLEQDQAPQFLSEDDFHENSYKLFGDSEDSENVESRNGDANNLETLWEQQELIEQLKLELRKVRDTGLPTILEESDTLKMGRFGAMED